MGIRTHRGTRCSVCGSTCRRTHASRPGARDADTTQLAPLSRQAAPPLASFQTLRFAGAEKAPRSRRHLFHPRRFQRSTSTPYRTEAMQASDMLKMLLVKRELDARASSLPPEQLSASQAARHRDIETAVGYARKRLQKKSYQNWWSWKREQARNGKQPKPQPKPASESHCGVCEKPTPTRSVEVHHAMEHASELSYRCDECDKLFARKRELEWHLRQHTGVRTLPCGLCPAEFLNGRLLSAHHTRHHGLGRSVWNRSKTN
ncbi:hypothetical protein HPB49_000221 [Dermacentor silvarum]|uniref:Uncharacterized protein n=1 Tax=Dermacentor silvarum TaxID=543639 RepID=A0ACB8DLW8_DERSI|nr:zinc finger protein 236-like [Dermacentor silvarum]KAH7973366.1 hypothetical protein HPB49_000221 [Dermacentor silvarum]